MTPVVADLLRRADYHLKEAEALLGDRYGRLAARESYQGMFHAAQAAVHHAMGSTPKTHSGLITRFGQLCREDGPLCPELGRQLSRSYGMKATADYGSVEEAQQLDGEAAVRDAREFVGRIRTFLATDSNLLE